MPVNRRSYEDLSGKKEDARTTNLSRLGLGTVQFGFDYGVNNSHGQVQYDEVREILERAADNGINFLDTSRLYGDSEKVLGQVMDETGVRFVVCTKLDLPGNYKELSQKLLREAVTDSFKRSREALKMDTIPMYLLHNYDYFVHKDGYIWNLVKDLQKSGRIGLLGVSITRGPEEAAECISDREVDVLQIPFNVFDQRWRKKGILEQCKRKNIQIISRSTYLQGLLLMDPDKAAQKVPSSFKRIKDLHELSEKWNIGIKELVFRYVLGNPFINTTIVGIDSCKQLEDNISMERYGNLPVELVGEIENTFLDSPEELVNPALWNISYQPKKSKKC